MRRLSEFSHRPDTLGMVIAGGELPVRISFCF